MYAVGDKVVYPRHGAGKIVKIERREVLGRQSEYLTVQILHNRMTVMIPVENAERVGLRKVIAPDAVDDVLEILRGDPIEMPKGWHDRARRIRERLSTGEVNDVAAVVRNLALRHAEKGLPTGEKQLFCKAKQILASEFMYARSLTEEAAAALLEDVLCGAHAGGLTTADLRAPEPVV